MNICKANGERGDYDYTYRFQQPRVVDPIDFDLEMALEEFRSYLISRGGREERRPSGGQKPSAPIARARTPIAPTPGPNTRNVFVVHGRDSAAREAMFGFLRALDLRPLEWDDLVAATGKGAPYIGEILDAAFSRAQAVVILLTPDDEVRLRPALRNPSDPPYESVLTGQARDNVLFEAGTALATHPERTVLVEIGELRPWSDVGGRHIVRLDGAVSGLHALATRLKTAACAVHTDGAQWLDTRPFTALSALESASDAT